MEKKHTITLKEVANVLREVAGHLEREHEAGVVKRREQWARWQRNYRSKKLVQKGVSNAGVETKR